MNSQYFLIFHIISLNGWFLRFRALFPSVFPSFCWLCFRLVSGSSIICYLCFAHHSVVVCVCVCFFFYLLYRARIFNLAGVACFLLLFDFVIFVVQFVCFHFHHQFSEFNSILFRDNGEGKKSIILVAFILRKQNAPTRKEEITTTMKHHGVERNRNFRFIFILFRFF